MSDIKSDAEIERLRAVFNVRNETANKQALEIQRLRGALQKIVNQRGTDHPEMESAEMAWIAREALDE